jgi:hypothetical protein
MEYRDEELPAHGERNNKSSQVRRSDKAQGWEKGVALHLGGVMPKQKSF